MRYTRFKQLRSSVDDFEFLRLIAAETAVQHSTWEPLFAAARRNARGEGTARFISRSKPEVQKGDVAITFGFHRPSPGSPTSRRRVRM